MKGTPPNFTEGKRFEGADAARGAAPDAGLDRLRELVDLLHVRAGPDHLAGGPDGTSSGGCLLHRDPKGSSELRKGTPSTGG